MSPLAQRCNRVISKCRGMNIYRVWLLVKRDYRLPIAKRFGSTAARTFDTNATEIGALGVSTFRHFSQSTLSTARRLCERYTFDIAIHFYEWQAAHIANLSDTLDICSNFYISNTYARVDVSIYDFERKFSGKSADVHLKMCNRITYYIIQNIYLIIQKMSI